MASRSIGGFLSLLSLSALAAGCGFATHRETRHSEVPHVAGSGLKIETENGSITVEAQSSDARGGPGAVRVDAEIRATTAERLAAVAIVAQRDAAGTLTIRADWPKGERESDEGCSFTVRLPDYGRLEADTMNGSIRCVGASGPVEASTHNGRISVVRPLGAVKAVTSNGAIEVEEAGAAVDALAGNGSIMVGLAPSNAHGAVLKTDNGSIRFVVGAGFHGTIDAKTDLGHVGVSGFDDPKGEGKDGAKVDRPTSESAHVTVGEGGDLSMLRAGNGSMRIERLGR